MAYRVCIDCPKVGPWQRGRCPTHDRVRDRARGTRQARGYDAPHDRLRAAWQRHLDTGQLVACWRCGSPIDPKRWHLGHDDHDRTKYRGPECVECNTATAARR